MDQTLHRAATKEKEKIKRLIDQATGGRMTLQRRKEPPRTG